MSVIVVMISGPFLPAGRVIMDNQKTQWDSVLARGESRKEIRWTAVYDLLSLVFLIGTMHLINITEN